MKLIFICVIVACMAVASLTARMSYSMPPLDWTTKTSTEAFPYATIAAAKDLLVYYETPSDGDPAVVVRRRNSEGSYDIIANITRDVSPQVYTANGKWIWTQQGYMVLFRIDENDQVLEPTVLAPNGGNVLSDDTLVMYEDGGAIKTYQYFTTNNTWAKIPGTDLATTTPVYVYHHVQSYRVYDTHLVLTDMTDMNNASLKLYQRQVDKAWSLIDTVQLNFALTTALVSVHYNGVDSIAFVTMVSLPDSSRGVLYMYTKKNGAWHEQMFNVTSVDYQPFGYLGASAAFVDANTLLVSAGTQGSTSDYPSKVGTVLMMKRIDGDWAPHLDIVGADADIFGLALAVNDYDLVVHEYSFVAGNRLRVFTAPICFAQPINVTCNSGLVSDCSTLSYASLYSLNVPPECPAVTSSLNRLSVVNDQLNAQFSFTRLADELKCNATVTCTNIPIAAPVSTNVPVKAPSSKNVNGGSTAHLSLALLCGLTAIIA